MKIQHRTHHKGFVLVFTAILAAFFSLAFIQHTSALARSPVHYTTESGAQPAPTLMPEAMVNFKLSVPINTPSGESIYLYILDEVTGLALNPQRMLMRANDPNHYMLSIPLPVGSLIRYRYGRQSTGPADEMTFDGKPVNYRLYRVDGPSLVQDTVARWTDTPFSTDEASGQPIPNLMVVCGGTIAQSGPSGAYTLAGLPGGYQNMVVFARDGSYRTFQQAALVAENSVTPASFKMTKAKMVNIVFSVRVPIDTPAEAALRIGGNISQLGNTFGTPSLNGEVDVKRMPKMVAMGGQRYALALQLPAGTDLRYKYTMGDSFWNAERDSKGALRVRQIVIPEESHVIDDEVMSWANGSKEPLGFEYHPPAGSTPGTMYIQFYSHVWTQPIPLWNSAGNRLTYILYGPLNLVGQGFKYRFCSLGQCDAK